MWNILRKGILDKDYLAKPSLSYVIFPILSRVVFWKSAYAFVYILTSVVNINTSLQFTILSLLYILAWLSYVRDNDNNEPISLMLYLDILDVGSR